MRTQRDPVHWFKRQHHFIDIYVSMHYAQGDDLTIKASTTGFVKCEITPHVAERLSSKRTLPHSRYSDCLCHCPLRRAQNAMYAFKSQVSEQRKPSARGRITNVS